MSEIDWNEWKERMEHVQRWKQQQRVKLRNLLESDIKEMTFTLKEFVDMFEDDEWKSDQLDQMEEALMRIASGEDDPKSIALSALRKYNGDE